jgi:TetR/AcrR family transcriptional repressor of nem operon
LCAGQKEIELKVTREKAAQNRTALIRSAGRLFRTKGIDGVGVAEICKDAGLTHGALYAQFSSKEALAAEALASGMKWANNKLRAAGRNGTRMADYVAFFASREQRDNIASGCAMCASASEIARQDRAVSARFSDGFEETVEIFGAALDQQLSEAERRELALGLVASLVGCVAVARATAKSNPALSDEIIRAVRRLAEKSAEAPKKPPQPVPRRRRA